MRPIAIPAIDTPYEFPGFLPRPAFCRLRIFSPSLDRPTVVVASDSPHDRGASITRYVENLAAIVCRHFKIAPETMIWIEHYNQWRRYPEIFRLVEFQAVSRRGEPCKPTRRDIDRATAERLIGGLLVD